jgi:gamma-glutamyltranspeptidase/glutathione hydrolase/leukotriene-C4 hydrolase
MKYFSFKLIKILTSDAYAEQIHKLVKDDTTFNESYYGPSWPVRDDHGTAHISVVAPNGEFI